MRCAHFENHLAHVTCTACTGIALPAWIVDENNANLIIGAYFFVFMILIPVLVGTWWYGRTSYYSDDVLINTVRLFFGTIGRSHCPQVDPVLHVSQYLSCVSILVQSGAFDFFIRSIMIQIGRRPQIFFPFAHCCHVVILSLSG